MPTNLDLASRADDGGHAVLRFHPLTFLEEGDEVVVGRADIDSYLVIPADGAALLRRLSDGARPDDAAIWYEKTYGEQLDIDGFVESLRAFDFIRDEDPTSLAASTDLGSRPTSVGGPVRWQRLGALVFSKPAGLVFLATLSAVFVLILLNPELAPRHEHVFFSRSLLVCELSLFALQLPLVLLHELAHVLAGRRLGLRTHVRVSRRLYFLVFETVMNGLVAVPRAKRYLPMLAGMLTDVLVAASCTLVAWWLSTRLEPESWVPGLFLALAFTTLLRITWQFYFFLRTDIYYLVTTVLGCVDLQSTTRQYLANRLYRLLRRTERLVPEDDWHPRDRQVARWYAPLVVTGYTLAIGLLVLVMVPIMWTFLSTAVGRALLGQASSGPEFWDSTILLALTVAQLAIAGVLYLREGRARGQLATVRDLLRRSAPEVPSSTTTPDPHHD